MISKIDFLERMLTDLDHIEDSTYKEAFITSIINELFELTKEE